MIRLSTEYLPLNSVLLEFVDGIFISREMTLGITNLRYKHNKNKVQPQKLDTQSNYVDLQKLESNIQKYAILFLYIVPLYDWMYMRIY
jgi:hypothetical protein